MNKGMIRNLTPLVFLILPLAVFSQSEIFKVVDEDGNVTFTDQRPNNAAEPMDLPPLSVIETDIQVPEPSAEVAGAAETEDKPATVRELRKQYGDFKIIQPQNEETFWGTANTVTVSWGSSQPLLPDMSRRGRCDPDTGSRRAPGLRGTAQQRKKADCDNGNSDIFHQATLGQF